MDSNSTKNAEHIVIISHENTKNFVFEIYINNDFD